MNTSLYFTIFLTIFASVFSHPIVKDENILIPFYEIDLDGNLIDTEDSLAAKSITVEDADVQFYYYSRINQNPVIVSLNSIDDLKSTDFDANRKTVYVIHGWNNDQGSDINTEIRKAVMSTVDYNIFIVNWGKFTHSLYSTAKGVVPSIGEIVAKFITKIGQDESMIKIIGHSLGAHVAGKAGSDLEGRISLITGLDAAMPFFIYNKTEDRLDPTDAQYVVLIHTCSGFLGFKQPLGHADFYPNGGGPSQPGCGLDFLGICAHSRAYEFLAESIISGNFVALKCDTNDDFKAGNCDDNPKANMGGLDPDTTASGTYYLKTNSKSPFALG